MKRRTAPTEAQKHAAQQKRGPYYVTAAGERRYFSEIADRIAAEKPAMIGQHISHQIDALSLRQEFDAADSPHAFPYSFSEYATHEFPPLEFYGTPGEKELALGPCGGGVAVADLVTTTGEGFFRKHTADSAAKWGALFICAADLLAAAEAWEKADRDDGISHADFSTIARNKSRDALAKYKRTLAAALKP